MFLVIQLTPRVDEQAKSAEGLDIRVLRHTRLITVACAFVKCAATFDTKILGQCVLHAGDMVTIPDRLEERIRKSEIEEIHDQVFRKNITGNAIELAREGWVATEWFFNDHDKNMNGLFPKYDNF